VNIGFIDVCSDDVQCRIMHLVYSVHKACDWFFVVQPTDDMLELATDKRDEAMAAMADG